MSITILNPLAPFDPSLLSAGLRRHQLLLFSASQRKPRLTEAQHQRPLRQRFRSQHLSHNSIKVRPTRLRSQRRQACSASPLSRTCLVNLHSKAQERVKPNLRKRRQPMLAPHPKLRPSRSVLQRESSNQLDTIHLLMEEFIAPRRLLLPSLGSLRRQQRRMRALLPKPLLRAFLSEQLRLPKPEAMERQRRPLPLRQRLEVCSALQSQPQHLLLPLLERASLIICNSARY